MEKQIQIKVSFFLKMAIATSVLLLIIIFSSCKLSKKSPPSPISGQFPEYLSDTPQVSWNVLFKPGTTQADRNNVIQEIGEYINQSYAHYNNTNGTTYGLGLYPLVFCPCDPLLYNINFSSIDAAGHSVTGPPPPPPGPAGSGDYTISKNIPINEQLDTIAELQYGRDTMALPTMPVDPSKKLAIIDAGIDNTFFTSNIGNLIWTDPQGTTLFNFLPYQTTSDYFDNTVQKHGTAVAATAIKAMGNGNAYPKIMILKALNEKNKGSIYSVSCAMSYAIQNHADVINLSLGYYGGPDSILQHYMSLASSAVPSIQVFAAAGNTLGAHDDRQLCNTGSNGNQLTPGGTLFYPACFNTNLSNITVVTQLNQPNIPCIYQNFSNQLVDLGIFDPSNCCAIKVGFLNKPDYYEGSSFATPVASGLKMKALMQTDPVSFWNGLIQHDPTQAVTKQGSFINYNPTWP